MGMTHNPNATTSTKCTIADRVQGATRSGVSQIDLVTRSVSEGFAEGDSSAVPTGIAINTGSAAGGTGIAVSSGFLRIGGHEKGLDYVVRRDRLTRPQIHRTPVPNNCVELLRKQFGREIPFADVGQDDDDQFFPNFSGRLATWMAAQAAAPQLMPHIRPSFFAKLRAVSMASSSPTWMTSSMISTFRTSGMKACADPLDRVPSRLQRLAELSSV